MRKKYLEIVCCKKKSERDLYSKGYITKEKSNEKVPIHKKFLNVNKMIVCLC